MDLSFFGYCLVQIDASGLRLNPGIATSSPLLLADT